MFGWFRKKTPAFAEPKPAKPEFREVATTLDGRDITRGWLSDSLALPSQDTVLEKIGGGKYDIYREVLSDWQVRSVFQQRQLALTACEWTVEPGGTKRADKNAAAWLEETLKTVGWDDATQGMHFGVFYGFAIAECLYARDGATVALDAIKVRDRRRFVFMPSGELRLLTQADPMRGEALPERKFWTFCTGADHDDEPHGMGLAHWLYWPVQFKRGNIKFWLIAAEKFGSPTAVGWFPPGTSSEDRARLLAALKAMQLDSGVILPDGMRAELLEAKRAAGIDYERLCIYLDQAIAKICLGQIMTSEAVGGQYKADVQNQVRQELIKADADLLCESFNRGPARWLTEWNFPGAAPPYVFRLTEPEEDLNGRAERERKLFDVGYRPTLQQVKETYGGEWEAVPADVAPDSGPDSGTAGEQIAPDIQDDGLPPTPVAFADPPEPDDPMVPLVERLGAESAPLIDALLEPVRQLLDTYIEDGRDLDDFREALADLYPDLDGRTFTDLMAQAMAVADAAGRFEAGQPPEPMRQRPSSAPPEFSSPITVQPHVTIHLADPAAPNITVNVPEQPVPNITVEAPQVTVHVPELPAPTVNLAAPQVSVHIPDPPPPSDLEIQIARDRAETARLERERSAEQLAFARESIQRLKDDDA